MNESINNRKSFTDLGISDLLLRSLFLLNYDKPSHIQENSFRAIMEGRDFVAQSQSGTGKSTLISLVLCEKADTRKNCCQSALLSPTREIASQSENYIRFIGAELGVKAHALSGGSHIINDIRKIKSGLHIISGTPGRVYELIKRGCLDISTIKVFVLDEADELLSTGFIDQIYDIYRYTHPKTQILLFSATFPKCVLSLTNKFMKSPSMILVKRDELVLDCISQFFILVEREEWKIKTLCDLYDNLRIKKAVIFCNTSKKVDWIATKMKERNFSFSYMHGKNDQKERNAILRDYSHGNTRLMVTTDVWARGIDVKQITLVIIYDVPNCRENYLHRIGRTGRYGTWGISISLVTNTEIVILRDIEQYFTTQIDEIPKEISLLPFK